MELLDGIGSTELFHIFISSQPGRARAGVDGRGRSGLSGKSSGRRNAGSSRRRAGDARRFRPPPVASTGTSRSVRRGMSAKAGNLPGDIYTRDSEGYFHYQCRDDDLIITSGYNVTGPEVENVLMEHAAVAETAGGGFAGRASRAYREGLRGAEQGLPRRGRAHRGAPKPCPRAARAVQVSSGSRLRIRASSHPTGKIRRVELRQQEFERKAARTRQDSRDLSKTRSALKRLSGRQWNHRKLRTIGIKSAGARVFQ